MAQRSFRRMSLVDELIVGVDRAVRGFTGGLVSEGRASPAGDLPESSMSESERRHAAGLMRVDHAGEVAAQALYHGQAFAAQSDKIRSAMEKAAKEEGDHLDWCRQRLTELGDRTSLLDPLWYVGSFVIGAAAGLGGDRWSLGFVVETERQVMRHLDGHLSSLPDSDRRSRAILEQMRIDEGEHATAALMAGAGELPAPVKRLMALTARIMTTTAYRL